MTRTEMRDMLAARGIQLTKSLGQNFLHDKNQLRRIVEAAELTKSDKVLEIGPGLGPLTELLVEGAGQVLAIEKDARLVEILSDRFGVGQASRLSLTGPERPKTDFLTGGNGEHGVKTSVHSVCSCKRVSSRLGDFVVHSFFPGKIFLSRDSPG